MTIVEAIRTVLEAQRRPMSAREIYEEIVAKHLFEFRTKNALQVVTAQLRRHTANLSLLGGSSTKHFHLSETGTYALLSAH